MAGLALAEMATEETGTSVTVSQTLRRPDWSTG